MFGFGGLGEIAFILFLAMLIFGPEELPENGRKLAKIMAEVRKASNELKRTLNAELAASEQEAETRRLAAQAPAGPAAAAYQPMEPLDQAPPAAYEGPPPYAGPPPYEAPPPYEPRPAGEPPALEGDATFGGLLRPVASAVPTSFPYGAPADHGAPAAHPQPATLPGEPQLDHGGAPAALGTPAIVPVIAAPQVHAAPEPLSPYGQGERVEAEPEPVEAPR